MELLRDKPKYELVLGFLSSLHRDWGWQEVGGLLGSMWLLNDGKCMGPALSGDWEAFVTSRDAETNSGRIKTEGSVAFRAMLFFLERIHEADRNVSLTDVIEHMALPSGEPVHTDYARLWNVSLEDVVIRGRVPESQSVLKEGVGYEIRRR
ncbi:hypothetical protein [Oleiagrimonas sp. MCCC 1A03011]|uniref:hypothetical protein n=1 Tax=Oleiagrimonas sp. MCCC 1A03011 TaxID=1926883 RepID=UPI0011BEE9A9|nr:hypothetical protein [Oleiagrimonas sp. MCCC 1A03011]